MISARAQSSSRSCWRASPLSGLGDLGARGHAASGRRAPGAGGARPIGLQPERRDLPQALSAIGLTPRGVAELIHFLVGLIAYPFGYIFIAQPVARTVVPFLPWWVVAMGYGVGLWVFALYIMAHLFAGLPPFLGFIPLAWASLAGHVLFALAGATVVKARLG